MPEHEAIICLCQRYALRGEEEKLFKQVAVLQLRQSSLLSQGRAPEAAELQNEMERHLLEVQGKLGGNALNALLEFAETLWISPVRLPDLEMAN
jgi:hypothetical protein